MNATTDYIKLFCLVALTLVCVGSLFTSQSISMMNPSMRVISARDVNQRFCSEPRKIARDCEMTTNTDLDSRGKSSQTKEECRDYRQVAKKCDHIVQSAFSYINMGGCPKQIKLLTLCEDEWCHQQNPTSCTKECAGVRKNFSLCVQETIEHYFKRNGLQENGTIG